MSLIIILLLLRTDTKIKLSKLVVRFLSTFLRKICIKKHWKCDFIRIYLCQWELTDLFRHMYFIIAFKGIVFKEVNNTCTEIQPKAILRIPSKK